VKAGDARKSDVAPLGDFSLSARAFLENSTEIAQKEFKSVREFGDNIDTQSMN